MGEGSIKLNESWDKSRADLYLKFKFTDAYRTKSDAATGLLGKPGDKFAGALEMGVPDFKRAKTDDEFYRFRIHGALGDLNFDPAGVGAGKRPVRPAPRRGGQGDVARPTPRPKPADGDDDGGEDVQPGSGPATASKNRRPAMTPRTEVTPAPRPEPEPEPEPAQPPPVVEDPAPVPQPEEPQPEPQPDDQGGGEEHPPDTGDSGEPG
jgi:hypothetical protein